MDFSSIRFQHGEILDRRFKVITPLNQGSFGTVVLADDLTTGKQVAIKCQRKPTFEEIQSGHVFEEAKAELRCHNILRHSPYIVNQIHYFETTQHTFLVLEYCSQGDLYEAIRARRGPLETEHVRRFMLQLISAVEHMHANGIYHRDIKPENIFLTAKGDMKLGDFGLATSSLWSEEVCVGSDRYMAPEQYDHGGCGYSPALADIWSLGICLLNVLFSRNPFTKPCETDVLFRDFAQNPQSLYDIFPSMSIDTFDVLSICLSINPKNRRLELVRKAVEAVRRFTLDDDEFDDFCTGDRSGARALATGNRSPLRTPSVSAQQPNSEYFSLQDTFNKDPVKPARALSSIPDDYDEDLFSVKDEGHSWYSGPQNTPSQFSSTFGSSFKSMNLKMDALQARRHRVNALPSSLPNRRAVPIHTMSSVFAKKDAVSKSWNDMFEEDEEEDEEAELRARRELNSRSFSHGSEEESEDTPRQVTPRPPSPLKPKVTAPILINRQPRNTTKLANIVTTKPTNENDPYVWQPRTPQRSPITTAVDRWSQLGDRRRKQSQVAPVPMVALTLKNKISTPSTISKAVAVSNSNYKDRKQSRNKSNKSRPAWLDQDWRQAKAIDSSEDEASPEHDFVGGWRHFHL